MPCFDKALDESTLTGETFTIESDPAITGTVSYDTATKTATFTSDTPLDYNTTYTVTLSKSVSDTSGNTLAEVYSWSFTTITNPDPNLDPDTTAPTTTASPVGGAYQLAQSVTLSCSDADSGCANTYFTLDGNDPTTASAVYASPITINTGTTTLKFYSVDSVGNVEATKTQVYTIGVVVDTTAPTTTASIVSGTYTSSITVTLTCTDASSGCKTTYYTVDGNDPTTASIIYSNVINIETDTTFKYFSIDKLNNIEPVKTETYVIGKVLNSISAGGDHTCAVLSDGKLKCWGDGLRGSETVGDEIDEMGSFLPMIDIGAERTVKQVVVGSVGQNGDGRVCSLLDTGNVICWGDWSSGQLGSSYLDEGEWVVVDLGDGRTVKRLAVGTGHSCAILDNDELKCWGDNGFGQLGLEDAIDRGRRSSEMGDNLPVVDLGTGRFAIDIAANDFHTCALLDDGTVKCWGYNNSGRLGYATGVFHGVEPGQMGDNLPVVNLGDDYKAIQISVGRSHSCALLDNGDVKCWGDNAEGQLGQGDTSDIGGNASNMGDELLAIDLGEGYKAVQLTSGSKYNCVLLDNRGIKCWGENGDGQLGIGDDINRGDDAEEMGGNLPFVELGSGLDAKQVSIGVRHSCALLSDNSFKCWGNNSNGQLGQEDAENRGDEPNEMGDDLVAIRLQ